MALDPRELAVDPRELAPRELAVDPKELAAVDILYSATIFCTNPLG